MKAFKLFILIPFFALLLNFNGFSQNPNDTLVMIANTNSGEIPYEVFFNSDLEVNKPNLTVDSYTFEFINKEGKLTKFNGRGNTLNDEMKFAIRVIMNDGEELTFNNIILIDKLGTKHSASPLVYKIKKKI